MTFRAFIVLLAASVLLGGVSGCSKEEPIPGPVVKKMAPKQGPAASPAGAMEEKKPASPQGPVYDPAGKRDPFIPFLKSERERLLEDQTALPPLQRYELGELKFVGVILEKAGARALVQDAEGKGYSVRVGTRIGRSAGVVTRITDKEITVKEEYPGVGGKTVSRESVLQLITAGGNQ
ncbi:MAG: putative Type pilus assembly protein PilP [Deltaproteobacteria bacterium]|nr:putative Type pilus assembly protein PilP [Deltaproteobacteria bacterium]